MANASREGARAASVSGNSPEADFLVLRTIEHGFDAWGVENLDFIVIYHATGPDDTVPESCKLESGSTPGLCNQYRAIDFQLSIYDAAGDPTGHFLCESEALDRFWCPTDRITGIGASSGDVSFPDGPAYIGIYMQARHEYMTGFIGSSVLLTDDQVIRIEPDRP